MHRTSRTHRFVTRIAATAVIALAPLAITAAPALAEPVAVAPSSEVEDVSRPGHFGHNHGHGRGWNHDRGNHSWNGWSDDGIDWNRGHRNRHGHGRPGRNHGWNHDRGWNHGHGLPLPGFFLPGTGSAF
ncbi:hypothetical protein [Nocardia sp. NPDC019395]|uniref:hypothetical protein n=1 Tax=Nocardia sp. NPDC019395 TaxID=3154686 RepID=UPI0033C155C3